MNDVRYALRTLARRPSFAVTAVATLALGITVNTVAFSLIDALVLRPMPIPEAGRVVRVYPVDSAGRRGNLFSYPDYVDYRDAATAFETLSAYIPGEMTVGRSTLDAGFAQPRAVLGYVVSSNYFAITGVRAALGRVLQPADERPGTRVVVLSQTFWRTRLAANPAAVGSALVVNGTPLTVVGIAAPGFAGTEPLVADCWLPLSQLPLATDGARQAADRDSGSLLVLGRLKPGVSRAGAVRVLTLAAQRLGAAYPGPTRAASVEVAAGTFFTIDPGLKPLLVGVMSVVGLVLLIAAANVANLALARAASRRRELALRLAIGASRVRIARQLVVEALLVGLAAGAAALLAAEWALRVLYRVAMSLAALPWAISLNLEPDVRVFGYTLTIALIGATALGALPALQASSPRLVEALHGHTVFGGRVRGRALRNALVIAQVAASLVLLFGAGLLLRALRSADALDLGFTTAGVIYADYDPRAAQYLQGRAAAFNDALLESARAMPGVAAAALTSHVPLHGGVRWTDVRLIGVDAPLARQQAIVSTVTPQYFSVLQLPFVAGRAFDAASPAGAVVISDGLARRFWPGQAPLGKAVALPGSAAPHVVVGVVRDAANAAIWREKQLAIYLAADAASDARDLRVLFRTTSDPELAGRVLAQRAATLAPDLRFAPRPLDELLRLWKLPSKAAAAATGVLAVMALTLACIGLYGVLSFAVAERTREIGIRMALGAEARTVVRLILADAWRLIAAGLAVGGACALPAAPLLQRLLFDVSAFDPLTLVCVPVLLTLVALAASYAPARRASRLEPLVVLRTD